MRPESPPGAARALYRDAFGRIQEDVRSRGLSSRFAWLFAKVRMLLAPGGLFVFDCPNRSFELETRNQQGWHNYNIYDVFYCPEMIQADALRNGFELAELIPIGENIHMGRREIPNQAISWVAACRPTERRREA